MKISHCFFFFQVFLLCPSRGFHSIAPHHPSLTSVLPQLKDGRTSSIIAASPPDQEVPKSDLRKYFAGGDEGGKLWDIIDRFDYFLMTGKFCGIDLYGRDLPVPEAPNLDTSFPTRIASCLPWLLPVNIYSEFIYVDMKDIPALHDYVYFYDNNFLQLVVQMGLVFLTVRACNDASLPRLVRFNAFSAFFVGMVAVFAHQLGVPTWIHVNRGSLGNILGRDITVVAATIAAYSCMISIFLGEIPNGIYGLSPFAENVEKLPFHDKDGQ